MKKLLKPKDILLLGLAGTGDLFEEAKDPLYIVSSAYKNMYGFIPGRYKKHNFFQTVNRSLKTGDIEKIVKEGKIYLRLTSTGRNRVIRDFPITSLTKKWNKKWIILIFDIAEKSRRIRDLLRVKLRGVGFGILQESVWLTPLPIGEDTREFIDTLGLSKDVFVMEVSHLIFGDPRELARRVWNLDKLEEEYTEIRREIEIVNQLIAGLNDRYKSREAKALSERKISGYLYQLNNKKRVFMNKLINCTVNLPPLPKELLPRSMQDVFHSLKI